MNYEKKYKEALERARAKYAMKDQPIHQDLADIFPELAESETKRMIQYFKDLAPFDKADVLYSKYGFSHKDAIDWLEKQSEHANFLNKIQIGDKVTRNEDGVLVNLSQLNRVAKKDEKQGEQKVEPKFKVGDVVTNKKSKDTVKIVQILHDSYCYSGWDGASTVHSDFSISEQESWELVKQDSTEESCKNSDDIITEEKESTEYKKGFECGKQIVLKYPEDFGLCKKPAWSEEDENIIKELINDFEDILGTANGIDKKTHGYSIEKLKEQIDWLKSLKDRVQPKQEWSEDDIKKISWILAALQNSTMRNSSLKKENEDAENWLKSLIPQKNNWERVTKEIYFKEPVLVRRKDKSDSWEGYRVCNDYTLNPQTDECYIRIKDINNQKHWKPTEEQMKVLNEVINFAADHGTMRWNDYIYNVLKGLREQLKKL